MRYDVVIIGGGLSGLMAGLRLQSRGLNTVIISSGQSSLHYSGGSLELLGSLNGTTVSRPLDVIGKLPDQHPYRVLGVDKIRRYTHEIKVLLGACGIRGRGSCEQNHWRLTPFGAMRPAWLTLDDYPIFDNPVVDCWQQVLLLGIKGFIDFYPQYLRHALSAMGVGVATDIIDIKGLEPLRANGTECRATAIARVLDNDPSLLRQMARAINDKALGCEAIIMPDVFGIEDNMCIQGIRTLVEKPLWCVSTMPVSVGGLRSQIMLRRHYERLGGTYLLGDKVTRGQWHDEVLKTRLKCIYTANFGPEPLEAREYIIAAGSMVSGGIVASPISIYEPIFGLDVMHSDELPHQRVTTDVFAPQPFMQCGVATDESFHAMIDGHSIENLQACGAMLGGLSPISNGTGGGVAVLTAMQVADNITAS